MYNIIMIGPQGSGKGTQGDKIAEKLGIPTVSLGKLFRAEIERNTGLGRDIVSYIERGDMVPDDLVDQVMSERLAEDDAAGGVIVDGFPRSTAQAEVLDEIFTKLNRQVTHVIYLEVSDAESIRRLSGRRVCSNPNCGLTYHVELNPPKKDPNFCDRCGSPLMQRQDDTPDAIKRRLELYHKETAPVVDFYAKRGILFRINGERPIGEVQAAIFSALGV